MRCGTSTDLPLVNERKLVAPDTLSEAALALLNAACLPDPSYPLGYIRSVYFDTPDLLAYDEKANGDHLKQKVRIRWYEKDPNAAGDEVNIFIEIKQREGAGRRKFRVSAKASAQALADEPLSGPFFPRLLRRHAPELAEPLPPHLLPSLCIAYERRRYVCPQSGSRAAYDRHIRAEANPALLPAATPIRLELGLCEFKNPGGEPPRWVEALYGAGFRMRSFSKYGACLHLARTGGL